MALAFAAQQSIAGHVDRGRLLFLAAAVVTAAGMRLIDAETPSSASEISPRRPPLGWRTRRVLIGALLLGFGLLASVATAELFKRDERVTVTGPLWAASIGLVLVGSAVGVRRPVELRTPRLTRERVARVALLLGIVGLAIALRLPRLTTIPPDVHGDEGAVGLDARALLHGGWGDLFRLGWAQVPQLSYAFVALFMRVFGDDLYGLRMASVFLGVLSVALVYLVARRLFGTRPALLSAFVLAVAEWHVHFSRTGFHYMQAVPATLLVFLFMLRAFETRRELDYVLAGVSLGICAIAYYAAREVFPIVGFYLLYRIVCERGFLRTHAVGLVFALVGFWVFLAPVAVTFAHAQGALSGRAESVWLFAHDNLDHERQVYGTQSTMHIVAEQTLRTVESVNRTGETSAQFGRAGKPLFDVWSAALIVPGFAYALSRIRRPDYLLLVLWLLLPMLACILAVDAPFSPHMVVALPVLAVFAALVLDAGWRAAERWFGRAGRAVFAVPVAAFAGLAFHANYHDYFGVQEKTVRVAGYYTLLSRYVLDVNSRDRVYLVGATDGAFGYDTVRFLVPHLDGADLGLKPRLPLEQSRSGKGAVFILEVPRAPLQMVTDVYPKGILVLHKDAVNVPEFFSYEVSASELRRRAAT